MSEAVDTKSCCASCGIAEIDNIKLMDCYYCDLVKYCSDECRAQHKSEHDEACKKRSAELYDERLFKQPEGTHKGDCPICMIPLSLENSKSSMMYCCSKIICNGCSFATKKREQEMRLQEKCPFCREPVPFTDEELEKLLKKRVEANDPVAMCQEGAILYEKGDYSRAFQYLSKSAELGNAEAHFRLSGLYLYGDGVEKDQRKGMHHLEEAAIDGHPDARYLLGSIEKICDNVERAVKHWIIAATQGYDDAIKALMDAFRDGFVSNEDLAAALRAHKAAVDATKSPERELEQKISNCTA